MRKLSKILAVVLSVVLLCGMIATMISADSSEVIYPEYVAPTGVTNSFGTDFEEGSGVVGTAALNGLSYSIVSGGSNRYANVTNMVGGSMLEHTASKQYGTVFSGNRTMHGGDYFVLSFDIMADKYTNGTDLISIEDYESLSDAVKAAYKPSYTQTYFYMEMPYTANGYNSFWIKQFDGEWYFTIVGGTAAKDSFKLPSEAGVWTNITMIVKTDLDVTYSSGTLSYAAYKAAGAPDSANATINLNTEFAVWANGEYAFDYAALNRVDKEYAYSSFTGANAAFKYMQMQAGTDSSSRVKAPMSMCYDNIKGVIYPDGYTGDLAAAFEARSSLLDTNDAVFNQNYNKTNSLGATVTKADGKTYGYMTVEQAYNVVEDGDTVEILVNNNATLVIDEAVKDLVVKTNGKKFNYVDGGRYDVKENAGTYTFGELKYTLPVYVGPVGPTRYGSYYDYDTSANKFAAVSDKNEIVISEKNMYGNTYASYTFTSGTSSSGELFRLGSWYNTPILKYDYITIDLDIVADGYRNKTDASIITIEAYEALSDSDKANYEAAYTIGQFYNEYNVISLYAANQMLLIKKVDGKYALTDSEGSFAYFLPEKAGVWTHITWVTKIGNTVTYKNGGANATMSYAEYVESGKGAADYVSVNLSESTQSIFVNGTYLGDLEKWPLDESVNLTAFDNLSKVYYKYLFFKGSPTDNISKFSENFSMGFDNNYFHVYNEGYNGDLVNAKETGLQNATDTIYNGAYNMTKSPAIIGVTNVGDELGKAFYSVDAAMKYAKDGAAIELLTDANVTLNMTGIKSVNVTTNGFGFSWTSDDGTSYVTRVDGDVTILELAPFGTPEYVGPKGVTTLWNFSDFTTDDYKKFYAANGLVHSNVNTGANIYSNITNWVDGAISEHTTNNSYGNLGNVYTNLGYGDYFVWSFDIMADKYTDGETLITIAEYEALSAAEKANFKPSYTQTAYMIEIPAYNCYNYLWIKEFDGKWYVTDKNAKISASVALPEVAGVWTNISIVFKTDMKVGGLAYNDYKAAGEPNKATAELTIDVEALLYANGEYAFNYMAPTTITKEYSSYSSSFKYAQMKAGTDSSARVKTPMSICYDNVMGVRYPEGYQGDLVNAVANKAPLHNVLDSVYNKTYNKTGTYAAVVYSGDEMGKTYFAIESAYAMIQSGDTLELFADSTSKYDPTVDVTYVKTNGYDFKYELPEGYTYYETETEGVYVLKAADENDSVEVKWYVDGELYATTTEVIGSTPKGPAVEDEKVHPWVSKVVKAWVDADGNSIVKAGVENVFTAEFGYVASPEILMNITTTQAISTNHYIPALTEEQMAEISDIFFGINSTTTNLWTTDGRVTNVTVGGKNYYKVYETMRIVYMATERSATFSFVYGGETITCEYQCSSASYFDRILSSNNYSDVEKELVYAALDYADAVGRYSGMNATTGYGPLVEKYKEYKSASTSTLDEIIATAKRENNSNGLITGYKVTVYDGYAAMFAFVYDTVVAGEEFDVKSAVIKYTTLAGGAVKESHYRKPDTGKAAPAGEITFDYSMPIYDVRQDLTLVVNGTESTFNLASYIKSLVDGGYAQDSAEMRIAIALYNYSECSEAYKRA